MNALTPRRFAATCILLLVGLAAAIGISLLMVVPGGGFDLSAGLSDPNSIDADKLRLMWPRIVHGIFVGLILGGSGAALQGLLRNPLADPFILGVSGGAALGVTCVATLGLVSWIGEAIGGFAGALGALTLVAALSTRNGRLKPLDMLLVGVVFNAFAGAMLLFLESLASAEAVQRVLIRLMGSLAYDPSQPLLIPALGLTAFIAAIFLARNAHALNLLALGDTTAESLGVAPHRLRAILFLVLSLPIGAVVAVSGMIGFVGLIVPHAVRLVLGPDQRLLIPASALVGAIFMLLADGAVRMLAGPLGTELPVGVMTATVGGPLFVILLRRSRAGGWL